MTLLDEDVAAPSPDPGPHAHAEGLVGWLTTTDHKKIGILYMATAFAFFLVGGVLALFMRAELARPGLQIVSESTYNQFFTMHGSVMMFLFAVPMAVGLGNYLVPLHIGAPDMAFPRLNALSYWLFVGGGLTMLSGFLTSRGAAAFGWTAYTPLSDAVHSPGAGSDLWIAAVLITGVSGVLSAVNIITTVISLRAPGMTMFRMPIFTWNLLVTSFMILLAFPVLTSAMALLYADRHIGSHFFDARAGGGGVPVLWQHLFWFFGHPEVYIVALPFFGVVTEIIPVFSRKRVFGYRGFVLATLAIAALSTAVWAHHMFATGVVSLPFFSILTYLVAVPTGVKFFNWIGTMWKGQISFASPMLFAIGFLLVFLVGGLTGPMLAAPPFDFHVTDTYFVVAHMHYVLFGAAVFGLFGGLYFWWPKFTGWRLGESLAKVHFYLLFIGFNLAFWPQHLLGLRGMPRRVADYSPDRGWGALNLVSTVGAFIAAVAVAVFLVNVVASGRRRVPAGDDPWGGYWLKWATSSPPPEHNFVRLPPIRSERPAYDARMAAAGAAVGAEGGGSCIVKVEWKLFAGAGLFFAVTGTVYWFVSYENAGTTMLGLGVLAVLMLAGWLAFQSRRVGMRPEDRPDALPEDGAGDLGYFPSLSVWPFVIGAGAVVIANGLVFGIWLGLAGGLVMLVGLVGYAAEAGARG